MWICVLFALDMYIVCVIIQVQWESKMPYEADEIKDVVALLRYLAAPDSNLRAAAFLTAIDKIARSYSELGVFP